MPGNELADKIFATFKQAHPGTDDRPPGVLRFEQDRVLEWAYADEKKEYVLVLFKSDQNHMISLGHSQKSYAARLLIGSDTSGHPSFMIDESVQFDTPFAQLMFSILDECRRLTASVELDASLRTREYPFAFTKTDDYP